MCSQILVSSSHLARQWQEYNIPGNLRSSELQKLQEEVNKSFSDGNHKSVGFTFHSHRSTVDGKTTSQTNFSVGKGTEWTPEERQALESRLVGAIGESVSLNR